MTKFFNSLLFKGVGLHLLLFIFLFLQSFSYNLLHLSSFFVSYFISLIVVVLFLIRPTQAAARISRQLELLITGNFSTTLAPKGHNDITAIYDQVITLGENVTRTQGSLENQRNQLDSVLTYMVDGVIATDRQGTIILANKAALNYLNTSEGKILNQKIIPTLQLDEQYSFYDLLEQEPELLVDTMSSLGDNLSLRVKFVLFRRESGFISGIIAILHDTTEQEKTERDQRTFVSNVSHELRTPLTSVKAYLEALEDGAIADPEVSQNFLAVSLNETNRMIRMISDLLTLSRIDQERLTLNKEVINLAAFLNFQVERLTRVANTDSKRHFQIVTHFPDEAIWVEIDTDKMVQVIDNLVGNAIKYSPEGGQITVSLEREAATVIIKIADQGMGIPKSDLNKIFKRFYRVDQARNSQTGGTGLGLSIVNDIVKLHGGAVTADSDGENLGTTFTITLPYSSELLAFDNDASWDEENNEMDEK